MREQGVAANATRRAVRGRNKRTNGDKFLRARQHGVPRVLANPLQSDSECLQDGAADGLRKIGKNEILLGVEVVLSRLVDDSDLSQALSLGIRNGNVDLPPFQ